MNDKIQELVKKKDNRVVFDEFPSITLDQKQEQFSPYNPPTIMNKENEGFTVEVAVFIKGIQFKGYYQPSEQSWWVDFGNITIGHHETSSDDIEKWQYLKK